jgi:phosphatidylglycerol:prolipoprotein diacylglycerol transferase
VLGPQLPYIKIPEIPLPLPSPFNSIKPFGLLVATGVYLGSIVALRNARQRGLDLAKMNSFIFWVVGIGFIGAHVLDAVFYTPERIARDPLYLLQIWAGLSSYGGFIGAVLGALLYKFVKNEKVLPYVDVVCSAFPLAWVFGRMGCSVVHDHPGRITESWLGVQYFHPDVRNPEAWGLLWAPDQVTGRFDLGLIEMVLTIPLAVSFAILWKARPRAYGFYAGWQCVLYAPVRFVLDFFRVEEGGAHDGDPRYAGLTPAQWACFGLVALGFYVLRLSKQHPAPAAWSDIAPSRDEDDAVDAEAEAEAARNAARRRNRDEREAGGSSARTDTTNDSSHGSNDAAASDAPSPEAASPSPTPDDPSK